MQPVHNVLFLSSGDEIVAINGRVVSGLTITEVLDLMQRQSGTGPLRIIAQRNVMMRRTNR